jgi:hypothetical protein
MSLLGDIIAKKVATAAANSTIKAVGNAAANVISASSKNKTEKEDMVVKNGVVFIKPTRSSENYLGENAYDIAQELLGAGFDSVSMKPIYKLSERSVRKYGRIESITINGKADFLGIKRIPASSYIVIEYLDFKQNIPPQIYANVQYICPGVMRKGATPATPVSTAPVVNSALVQHRSTNNFVEYKRFCIYCGHQLQGKEARFCAYCGQAVESD